MSLPEPPLNASRVPPADRRQTCAEVRAPPRLANRPRATAFNRSCQFFETGCEQLTRIYLTVTETRAPSAPFEVAITLAVPGKRPVMRPVAASRAITLESVDEPKLHFGDATS